MFDRFAELRGDTRLRPVTGSIGERGKVSVATVAKSEPLAPGSATPFPATLTEQRVVSAQALAAWHGCVRKRGDTAAIPQSGRKGENEADRLSRKDTRMTRHTPHPRLNPTRLLAQLAGKDATYGRRSAAVVIAAALIVGFVGLDGAASTSSGDHKAQSARDQANVRRAMSLRTVKSVAQGKRLAAAAGVRGHTLTFITHVIPGRDAFVDVPPTDISPGDIFVQEAEVFNASHSKRIGEAILRCDLNIATITCNHAISLNGRGKLLISKPFIGDEMGAITGGTGDFKDVSGQGTWFNLDAPDFDMMFIVELRH